jgi:hypothetical protein
MCYNVKKVNKNILSNVRQVCNKFVMINTTQLKCSKYQKKWIKKIYDKIQSD